jgi:Periplasmic pectate lyase
LITALFPGQELQRDVAGIPRNLQEPPHQAFGHLLPFGGGEGRSEANVPVFQVRTLPGKSLPIQTAKVPQAPVPKSPYLTLVYRYADTLLEHGRDTFGPRKTGLFLSALDRDTLRPLTNRPPAPTGVREGDRVGELNGPLVGANPQHDENLLRLLEVLSGLSGRAKYKSAADGALQSFLNETASPETSLLPWGEHLSWDVLRDQPCSPHGEPIHEFFRPWMLWDRCFDLAPDASRRFALGLWEHQIADPATGAFDRHALYERHGPRDGSDFPRHAGFYLRTWAVAYARTEDPKFLRAMEVLLKRFEAKRDPQTGWIESSAGQTTVWPPSNLSLAIDCYGASLRVPEPLAGRLRAFADREDQVFCRLPHDLKGGGGFAAIVDKAQPAHPPQRTALWETRYGAWTTAQVGMMCVARYDNVGLPAYRDLIMAAADAYLDKLPGDDVDPWPSTLGQAISLQLAAWRHSARPRYLAQARALADWAIDHFWDLHALPRASRRVDHYETITGCDTLALALVELHLQILHITAVRCPPNTLDR